MVEKHCLKRRGFSTSKHLHSFVEGWLMTTGTVIKLDCGGLCNESCCSIATPPRCALSHLLLKLWDHYVVVLGLVVFKLLWACEDFGSDFFPNVSLLWWHSKENMSKIPFIKRLEYHITLGCPLVKRSPWMTSKGNKTISHCVFSKYQILPLCEHSQLFYLRLCVDNQCFSLLLSLTLGLLIFCSVAH